MCLWMGCLKGSERYQLLKKGEKRHIRYNNGMSKAMNMRISNVDVGMQQTVAILEEVMTDKSGLVVPW